MRRLLDLCHAAGEAFDVPAGVLAQVWRGGPRQARLAKVLNSAEVTVPPLDHHIARLVGEVCARTGATDVVDVHVAVHARAHRQAIVTSDPDDFAAISPDLDLIVL